MNPERKEWYREQITAGFKWPVMEPIVLFVVPTEDCTAVWEDIGSIYQPYGERAPKYEVITVDGLKTPFVYFIQRDGEQRLLTVEARARRKTWPRSGPAARKAR